MEHVNYEVAKQKADTICNITEEVSRLFNEAISEMDSNIGNKDVWLGGAASNFKAKWDEFTNEFNIQIQHILTVRDKIEYTNQEMHRAEAEMQEAANSSVNNALGE